VPVLLSIGARPESDRPLASEHAPPPLATEVVAVLLTRFPVWTTTET
jgi:hypothetical protein